MQRLLTIQGAVTATAHALASCRNDVCNSVVAGGKGQLVSARFGHQGQPTYPDRALPLLHLQPSRPCNLMPQAPLLFAAAVTHRVPVMSWRSMCYSNFFSAIGRVQTVCRSTPNGRRCFLQTSPGLTNTRRCVASL